MLLTLRRLQVTNATTDINNYVLSLSAWHVLFWIYDCHMNGRFKRCMDVNGGCERWMWTVDVICGCERWMGTVDVIGLCERWTVDMNGGCERWMWTVDVNGGCERWMWTVDVNGGWDLWIWTVDVNSERCNQRYPTPPAHNFGMHMVIRFFLNSGYP